MSNNYKKEIKKVFKLDSAKNIAGKLLNGQGDPNMVGGTIGGLDLLGGGAVKGFVKGAKGFIGKARQFLGKKPPKKGFFKPMHRDGKVYDTQSINDAFSQRFGKPQNVVKKATEGKGELAALKKAKNMASKAGPKNSVKSLSKSSTRRTNFTSGR